MSGKAKRRPWGAKFDAEVKAAAVERKRREAAKRTSAARQLAGLRRFAEARKALRVHLLAVLVAEGARTVRLRTFVDESTAPTLYALAVLARHFLGASVQFRAVRFPVRRSSHGFAILHPDTRDELVTWLH